MTLNTQQEAKTPLRRRASTPLSLSPRGRQPGLLSTAPSVQVQSQHPRLGQSASLNPPNQKRSPAPDDWSSESSDSEGSWEALYRVVLLGDPGVGKTSLASLFAGKQERDLHEQLGEDVYERTLTVDGEDTTLVVVDTWEAERLDKNWSQESCLEVGSAYVIVYSIADRGSFESASELRIQLRRTHQADHVPIILVGNKADLARCREVSVEGVAGHWECILGPTNAIEGQKRSYLGPASWALLAHRAPEQIIAHGQTLGTSLLQRSDGQTQG
ncbi:GTP-binding protein REM 1 isoform X2 [Eulemur rufifrons]|uniref:GTP-binding protein REM 1 isoform X2 n=1 Tax=Eulemur rufifrons TaxID=859984 RepID=UPI003743EE24